MLSYILDENEFLSPFGIGSISRIHEKQPLIFRSNSEEYRVEYVPGESTTALFGGISSLARSDMVPGHFLIIEVLQRDHHYFGKDFLIECPTGQMTTLNSTRRNFRAAREVSAGRIGTLSGMAHESSHDLLEGPDPLTNISMPIQERGWGRVIRPDGLRLIGRVMESVAESARPDAGRGR